MSRILYSPVSPWVLILLILLVIIGLPLLFFGLIGAALANLGFGFWGIVFLIIAIIVGSFINLPVTTLYPKKIAEPAREPRKPRGQYAPSMYDKMYRTERFEVEEPREQDGMKICINVGGALIPLLIAVYLVFSALTGNITADVWYFPKMVAAVAVVSAVSYFVARPVKGIGIAAPFFTAPLVALCLGLLFAGGFGLPAAGIAFVAGTLGTVIGADILHLRDIASHGAKMVSIGGAGTFDGIFLTGIVTALLASI